nr:hypothetical protein Iba_chr05bCG6500 [Ipomoea batatas]
MGPRSPTVSQPSTTRRLHLPLSACLLQPWCATFPSRRLDPAISWTPADLLRPWRGHPPTSFGHGVATRLAPLVIAWLFVYFFRQ